MFIIYCIILVYIVLGAAILYLYCLDRLGLSVHLKQNNVKLFNLGILGILGVILLANLDFYLDF